MGINRRTIQPQATKYKGRLFRSKLEAKAAQWLDKNGFQWIYEPETLMMGSVRYTPDFYICEIDTLIEVKPIIALAEFERVEELIVRLRKPCLILSADEFGEIEMHRLWNYSGPCGNGTGDPNCWTWHEKADFSIFNFGGKQWIAGNICCTKIYGRVQGECSCHR